MANIGNRVEINTGGGSIQDTIILSDRSKVTKVVKESNLQPERLQKVADELNLLLEQISREIIDGETLSNAEVGAKAVRLLKKDKPFKDRVISAVREGSVEALKQLMQHPAAAFFISALKEFLDND